MSSKASARLATRREPTGGTGREQRAEPRCHERDEPRSEATVPRAETDDHEEERVEGRAEPPVQDQVHPDHHDRGEDGHRIATGCAGGIRSRRQRKHAPVRDAITRLGVARPRRNPAGMGVDGWTTETPACLEGGRLKSAAHRPSAQRRRTAISAGPLSGTTGHDTVLERARATRAAGSPCLAWRRWPHSMPRRHGPARTISRRIPPGCRVRFGCLPARPRW